MNRQQQIEHFVAQAHALSVQRLIAAHERVSEVQLQLSRWRLKAPDSRSDVYWNEWEQLLVGDVQNLALHVCADTDHAALLRSVTQMSVLITQTERAAFICQARQFA